jgi:3-oxoacyl-[acyl-carrier protein] reductase
MKYILVTGGSRGIGRAVCIRLAQMGLPIIINYRSNEAAAKETQQLVEAQGVNAELMPFDVCDEAR